MKIKTNGFGHTEHYYISDGDFMLNYTPYEYDELSGRYYYLEPSISLTSKAGREGGLVRRRISKADYESALGECKTRFAETFKDQEERPHEELLENTAADALHYRANRIEGKMPAVGAFVPHISAKDMIDDFDQELRYQIKSTHYPSVNPETARHELYGFMVALRELGLYDSDKCFVVPGHFTRVESDTKPIGFINLPPLQRDSSTAREVYALGVSLLKGCPENDCRIYLNNFCMCRELDEQAKRLDGWPREVVESNLRKLYFELETMYTMNYAIKKYRRGEDQNEAVLRHPLP
jgi:hypothetical protein